MAPEQIAMVCHETNRAYCQALGDYSQPLWPQAPDWQKSSAINGVIFHLNNPNAPASRSHELWLEQKKREGWKWGPTKNPDTKEHPCFLPFDRLPLEQQFKDALFIAVVDALRPLADRPAAIQPPS
jgi:hypothetical protein